MNGRTGLIESEDRWLLPYRDMQVIQIRVSCQLTLVLDGAQVELENEAVLTDGPLTAPGVVPVRLDPACQDVVPALSLFGAKIRSAVAFKTGALWLVFDTGAHLNVNPDPQYEAWNARGPGDLCLVCQPGGAIAVWT
ncbi:DUF6188 family protein [Micromonospora sp. DT233]|uniref:DUF6188 family protein n=1 Tax=Micromonospora sp. DT233 TaxID=3393432 RepID=UPI003CE733C0